MIKQGSTVCFLRMDNTVSMIEIGEFSFHIHEASGAMDCYVYIDEAEHPTWLILDLIKSGHVWLPENNRLMTDLWERRGVKITFPVLDNIA